MKCFASLAFASLLAGRLVCVGQVIAVGPVPTFSSTVQVSFSVTALNSVPNYGSLPESPDSVVSTLNSTELAPLDEPVPFRVSSGLNLSPPPAEPIEISWTRPLPERHERRTADSKYFLLNGLELGMGMFDVAMTQHCIADQHCREGNPLMPSSLGGQLGFNFGYAAYSSFMSYKLKKRHSQLWFLAPTAGIAAHGAGVASGFEHY